jgi:hypothetical protein
VFDETAVNTEAAIKAAADKVKADAAELKNWKQPRTPWGDPDIQGYYFNHSSYTPLERPVALKDKAFLHRRRSPCRVQAGRRDRRRRRSARGALRLEGIRDGRLADERGEAQPPHVADRGSARRPAPPLTPEAKTRLAAGRGPLKKQKGST